ncbi:MAG: hypothetical protein IJ043_09000 [Clostridia bacterium]|nr:hypothetical protein [Clostridia bacterium]
MLSVSGNEVTVRGTGVVRFSVVTNGRKNVRTVDFSDHPVQTVTVQ